MSIRPRCVLRDLLPLFLPDGPSHVPRSKPLVLAMVSTSSDTQPNFRILRTTATVAVSAFRISSCSDCWRCFTKLAAFIRLVLDTFGRVPTVERRHRATSFQAAAEHRLFLFTRPAGCLSGLHLLMCKMILVLPVDQTVLLSVDRVVVQHCVRDEMRGDFEWGYPPVDVMNEQNKQTLKRTKKQQSQISTSNVQLRSKVTPYPPIPNHQSLQFPQTDPLQVFIHAKPCLFRCKPDWAVAFSTHTLAHSSVISFHTWSPSRSMASLSRLSFRMSESKTDGSCSVFLAGFLVSGDQCLG